MPKLFCIVPLVLLFSPTGWADEPTITQTNLIIGAVAATAASARYGVPTRIWLMSRMNSEEAVPRSLHRYLVGASVEVQEVGLNGQVTRTVHRFNDEQEVSEFERQRLSRRQLQNRVGLELSRRYIISLAGTAAAFSAALAVGRAVEVLDGNRTNISPEDLQPLAIENVMSGVEQ